MQRAWKILLFAIAGLLLVAACTAQTDVTEIVANTSAPQDEVVAVEVEAATAVPDTPIPTAEPTEIAETIVEETAVQAENSESILPPPGQTVNEYVNVSYTQEDGELIGKTNRAQFLALYTTW